jgi:hypothetical protein
MWFLCCSSSGRINKRPLLLGGLCLVLLAGVLIVPDSRLVLLGWLRGESFYHGRPTCYWHREVSQCQEVWSPLSQDYALYVREPTNSGNWLRFLTGSSTDEEGMMARPHFPPPDGDPAALPVLRELLRYPDCKARRAAAMGLGSIGPQAKEAIPGLLEIARTTPDCALYICACDALRNIDPEGAAAAHLERRDFHAAFELMP